MQNGFDLEGSKNALQRTMKKEMTAHLNMFFFEGIRLYMSFLFI